MEISINNNKYVRVEDFQAYADKIDVEFRKIFSNDEIASAQADEALALLAVYQEVNDLKMKSLEVLIRDFAIKDGRREEFCQKIDNMNKKAGTAMKDMMDKEVRDYCDKVRKIKAKYGIQD